MKNILLAATVALSVSALTYPASADSNQRPLSLLIVNSSKTPVTLKSVTIAGAACATCAVTVAPHSAWVHAIGTKKTAFQATVATPSGNSATIKVDGQGGQSMSGLNDPAVVADSESEDAYMGSFDPKTLGTYTAIFIADRN